jgi:hypothetical protein
MRPSARAIHPDELSDFHAVRAELYLAAFELLRLPPSAAVLRRVREQICGARPHLREMRGLKDLDGALEQTSLKEAFEDYARLFGSQGPPVSARCENPGCQVRGEAFAAVAVLPAEERVSELKVLGLLAERTTEALGTSSLPEASILTDVQGRFLVHHAGHCLGAVGEGLRRAASPLYSRVGAALAWLIEEDLRLLGYPDASP